MPFLDSLAAQLNDPSILEALRNRAPAPPSGALVPPALPLDPQTRYAANVTRALAPPVVTEPSLDDVQSAIALATPAYRPGVSPDYYGVGAPRPIESPPVPIDPSQHPAVLKRKAMGPKGIVPGLPGGVRAETIGTPPPPSPELLAAATEALPVSGHTVADAAVLQPAMQPASSDFSTGALPWRDPAFIRRQYGIPDNPAPAVPQAGHGFLAHLKGLMEGLGAGLASGHPLAGAIMGVAGGVKPQLGANAWYNNVTLPRWQAQQDQALDRAAERLAIDKSAADLTGTDLITGEPTFAARQAEARSELANQIAQVTAAHNKALEDTARQRETDMAQVARGNLDIKEALAREKIRTDQAMETLRQQLLKIQQQNADASTLRAGKSGQPRTSTTTRILGPNPDHVTWEKERDAALAKNPGAPVSDLIKGKLLRREPQTQIQTGTRTTRGPAQTAAPGKGARIPAALKAKASQLSSMLMDPRTIQRLKKQGLPLTEQGLRQDLANLHYTIDENK